MLIKNTRTQIFARNFVNFLDNLILNKDIRLVNAVTSTTFFNKECILKPKNGAGGYISYKDFYKDLIFNFQDFHIEKNINFSIILIL